MMSVPVISAGIKSGVNWIRLNDRLSVRESVLMSSVFARPGTPSSMQCPRLNKLMSNCSTTASWPTITWASCSRMRSTADASFSMICPSSTASAL
jgi:hypothetical protein